MASEDTAAPARYSAESVGIACAITSTLLLSMKPILIKVAYANGLSPDSVLGLRMIISLPFFVVIGVLSYRRLQRPVAPGLLAGAAFAGMLAYYVAAYLDLLALNYITAQLERIVLFTYPTWVILFGALLFGEAITARKLISLALAYLGVVAVVGREFAVDGENVMFGVVCVFGATLTFSAYMLLSKRYIAALGTGLFGSVAMGSSTFLIGAHLAVVGGVDELIVAPEMYAVVFALAIGATVVPTYFMAAAVHRIGAGPASIVSTAGPPVTSAFAVLWLGEAFTPYHALGLALTCSGIVVLTWKVGPFRAKVSGP